MKHGSLFSGIGGFDLAAQWMGWDNVFHCEIEEYNQKVLKHYWPKAISYADITKTDFSIHEGAINVLTGGFPCQDISIANQSKHTGGGIHGQRSGLWSHYARAIREIRPNYIVFENSPMLIQRGLEVVLCDLAGMGYNAEWRNFYATQFGFNHRRKRTYGIAYASGIRCKDNNEAGGILSKILSKQPPRQNPLSMPFERFNSKSDYSDVRMDDGFPTELDRSCIKSYGNAIVPEIALQIFKAIEAYATNPQ